MAQLGMKLAPVKRLGVRAWVHTAAQRTRRIGVPQATGFIVVTAVALAFLFPLYWMIITSLEPGIVTQRIPPDLFPTQPTLDNFRTVLTAGGARWLLNSIIVATGGMVVAVTTSLLAGYAFGKKRFPGRTILFWTVLAMMMMPSAVTVVPLFITMRDLNLVNTYLGMFITSAAWPFGIYFVRQYMSSLPDALLEAARVDGAREWALFRRIVLPLSRPAIGVLAILSFVGTWGHYLWQLVMASDESMYTVLIGASSRANGVGVSNWGVVMAASTLAFVPMLMLFLRFQGYFLRGIYTGSLNE